MAKDINEKLRDSILKRNHYVHRFENGLIKDNVQIFNNAKSQLVRNLQQLTDAGQGFTKQYRIDRLNKQMVQIDSIMKSTTEDAIANTSYNLNEFGFNEKAFHESLLSKTFNPIGINTNSIPQVQIAEIINTPLGGALYSDRMMKNYGDIVWTMREDLTQSIILGEDMEKAARRLIGTGAKVGGKIGGKIAKQSMAIARSEIQRVSVEVSKKIYEANQDVLKGYEYLATLDDRTCLVCGPDDGKIYDFNKNPISADEQPPRHPYCRCFIDYQASIYTSKGNKKIGEVKVGDLVLTHKGRFRKVTKLFRQRKWQGDVTKITCLHKSNPKTKKGYNDSITVTSNHHIQVFRDNQQIWLEALQIKEGDFLYIRANRCRRCNELIPYNKVYCTNSCRSKDITDKQWADPEHRKNMSKKISKKNKEQYKNGERDRFKTTQAANKKMRQLVAENKWHPSILPGDLNPSKRPEVRKIISDGKLGKKNPMHKDNQTPEFWKKISDDMKQRHIDHPEKHPNYIMAQKGYKTGIEKIMDSALQEAKIKATYNFSAGNKWIDYAIESLKIGIECDGEYWHQDKEKDHKRDLYLEAKGWTMIHFTETQINDDIDSCIKEIKRIMANHNGEYEFMKIPVVKTETWVRRRPGTTYNLQVEEDESYIGSNFIVHNCTLVPLTKSWKELGGETLKEVSPGTRASFSGQVPSTLSYTDWFAGQSAKFQKSVLGKTRYELYNSGQLKLSQMATSNKILNLKQLDKIVGRKSKTIKTIK